METEEVLKIKKIEVNDERNERIREKTGYMVSKVMNYVLVIFILVISFLGADKSIIILASGLIVIEFSLVIVFSNILQKEFKSTFFTIFYEVLIVKHGEEKNQISLL